MVTMPTTSQDPQSPASPRRAGGDSDGRAELSPELVRRVADRVWAMLRRDLELERERRRPLAVGEFND
jgi:hypothetical protein